MSLLTSVKQATSDKVSDIKVETVTTSLTSLSTPIEGKYGKFRQFTCKEGTFNVDDNDVVNAKLFQPNCEAIITIKQYKNSEGDVKTIIQGLNLTIQKGFLVAML